MRAGFFGTWFHSSLQHRESMSTSHLAKAGTREGLCLSCGACCAFYRVSFYWAEAVQLGIDAGALRQVNPWLACMAGTEKHPPRCHALQGEPGHRVACSIYAMRPSPCRELQPGEEKCNRARAAHGLPPLLLDTQPDMAA